MFPRSAGGLDMDWLHALAVASLVVAAVCAMVIVVDIVAGHPQKMAVMNAVWPISALYMGPGAIWAYYAFGRSSQTRGGIRSGLADAGSEPHAHGTTAVARDGRDPSWQSVFKGVTHCAAGCTLGDIAGDWTIYATAWTIAGSTMWPRFAAEFAAAFLFGIAFQYFAIVPMRHLKPLEAVAAAVRADALSISAYEFGMFAWMLVVRFLLFGHDMPPTDPLYWFMMQIAMLWGFAASYPMNRWLIRQGWKEPM